MDIEANTRRRFLIAAIAGSGAVASGLSLTLLNTASAWAAARADGSTDTTKMLVGMVRLYYPHDSVPDDVYVQTVDSILSAAASDVQLQELLDGAYAALDAAGAGRFADADATAQLAAMTSLQDELFFTAIKFQVLGRFYAHPEVWKAINYPGSSVEHGGYVDRGFDDIDWLPEQGG